MTNNEMWFDKLKDVTPWGSGTSSKRARLLPEEPAVVVRGFGCRIYDADGKEYIDYKNALGPVTLGYCYPEVDEAIIAQLRNGISFSYPTPLEYEVASRVVALRPHFGMARFLKSGGEACSAAIKLARGYTEKDHIIQIGYNGWLNTLGSGSRALPGVQAVGEIPGVPRDISMLFHSAGYGNMDKIASYFDEYDNQVAAVIVAAGYPDFYKGDPFYHELRALCDKNKALLITDDIVTGFRVATAGVGEYFGFEADLTVYAKGFANGMPLACVAGRKEIMGLSDVGGKIGISSTYAGETLSLAAAVAVMDIFKRENVVKHMWDLGERLCSAMNNVFTEINLPLNFRGAWPCMNIAAAEGAPAGIVDDFFRAAFKRGVALYNCCYINFSHKKADIDETIEKLRAAADECAKKGA